MVIDSQINLSGRLSAIELAELNEATEGLRAYMVLASAALAGQEDVNEIINEFCEKSPKAVGFGVVNPADGEDSATAEKIARKWNFKGFALYPVSHGFHPADTRAMEVYRFAEANSMPVFFYIPEKLDSTDMLEFGRPYLIDEIARAFPKLKIVLSSCGMPFVSETVALLAKNRNVYSTLTITPKRWFRLYTLLLTFFEGNAINKLLFASNYPEKKPNECIEALLGFNRMISDTQLPVVPLDALRRIVNADAIDLLGIKGSYPDSTASSTPQVESQD
ncbi:MAG: amidohydrolase family protein [Phycisphaerae bacterium]|jgi:predicted TIM-barrel fold metal-dependent hydrolase